jgi:hypothetical protein
MQSLLKGVREEEVRNYKVKYSKVGSRKEKSNVEEEWEKGRGQRREVETKSLCYQSLKEGKKLF